MTKKRVVQFGLNLTRRVKNYDLPPHRALDPLMEAVVNATMAIEDRFGQHASERGKIEIRITRDTGPLTAKTGSRAIPPVLTFEIVDNGIGFDDAHFRAFTTSDSAFREEKGGKGIGRFSWLKAFKKAEIDSIYQDGEGQYRHRKFVFTLDGEDGIELDPVSDDVAQKKSTGTRVRLDSYKPDFRQQVHKKADTIAHHVVNHCLDWFALGVAPAMKLVDADEQIDLNEYFDTFDGIVDRITLSTGHEIVARHFLIRPKANTKHSLNLVADRRVVEALPLDTIADLPSRIEAQAEEQSHTCVYVGYAHGEVLDKAGVDSSRSGFLLPPEPEEGATVPSLKEIRQALKESAERYLGPYIKPITQRKMEKVKAYVCEERRRWVHLLRLREDDIRQRIPEGMDREAMDVELYRIDADYRAELARENRQLIHEINSASDHEEYKQRMSDLIERVDEVHKSALVDYVTHRKVLLDLLDASMERDASGRYVREDIIHKNIAPMRRTSDDADFERKQNLWLLNEGLAFHHWVGSDKPLRSTPAGVDSGDEPDLASFIYDNPHAFIEGDHANFDAVTIVEFKRPERDDYTDDDNPYQQVLRYVKKLRSGKGQLSGGRTIPSSRAEQLRYYCYIVCTFTDKLETILTGEDFKPMPERDGFFRIHDNYSAYFEVISFERMLSAARQRNRIFFQKLGLKV